MARMARLCVYGVRKPFFFLFFFYALPFFGKVGSSLSAVKSLLWRVVHDLA